MADKTNTLRRTDNPRLISREEWWIQFARWSLGKLPGPICTECGDPLPGVLPINVLFLVCDECKPYVPESERGL